MNLFLLWAAVICFAIATILAYVGESGRVRWILFAGLGLTAWALDAALLASHVINSH